jgi:hypothetical protein
VVADLQVERDGHDNLKASTQTLQEDFAALNQKFGMPSGGLGELRWDNFKSNKLVSAKYINNLAGAQSVELFEAMFDTCNIKNATENLRLRGRGLNYDSDSNRMHRRLLTPIDGMFLCLVRCRTGLSEELIGLFFVWRLTASCFQGQSRGSLSHSEGKIFLAVWAFLGVGCDGSFRAVRRAARDGPMGCARAPLLAQMIF